MKNINNFLIKFIITLYKYKYNKNKKFIKINPNSPNVKIVSSLNFIYNLK